MKRFKLIYNDDAPTQLERDIIDAGAPEMSHKEFRKLLKEAQDSDGEIEFTIDANVAEELKKMGMTAEGLIKKLLSL